MGSPDTEARLEAAWAALVSSPTASAVVGADGTIVRANRGFCSVLGRTHDSLIGMKVCQLVHPDDLPGGSGFLDRPLSQGRHEIRWVRQDGQVLAGDTLVWLITDPSGAALYTDDAGEPLFWLHQVEDVTQRHHLTRQLQERDQMIRLMIESITDYAVFQLDPDGTVTTWNPGAQTIKGYGPEEIVGRPYRVFFTAEDASAGIPEQNLERARRAGRASGEGWRRRKDGSLFWAAWALYRLDMEGQVVGFAKVTRDLTEQRAAAARLVRDSELLEEANRALAEALRLRDDLLDVAHHEIRTPLTVLSGFSETLLNRWERLGDEERETALAAMREAARRLENLVDNLLALNRLHSGPGSIARETVRLSAAVLDAASLSGTDLDEARVEVANDLAVLGDPARIRQVIGNLFSNAVLYGRGVTEVKAGRRQDTVWLEVADEGPGVPPDFAAHLFERFAQASRGSTRTAVGTGLGLAIVKELTEAQGGAVRHEPNHPSGARFVIELPSADSPENGPPPSKAAAIVRPAE